MIRMIKQQEQYDRLYISFRIAVQIVLLFWFIRYLEHFLGPHFDSSILGVQPRKLIGLLGILTSPFIHGNQEHLASNSIPFVVLFSSIMFFYAKIAKQVIFGVYFMTGIGIWLFARENHSIIGSSGLIYGFASFLIFSGFFRQSVPSLAISLAIFFLYSSLIYGFFPKQGISHEAHLSGAISGVFYAYAYRSVKIFKINDVPEKEEEADDGFVMMHGKGWKYDFVAKEEDQKDQSVKS